TIDTGRAAAPRTSEFRESPAARQTEAPDTSPAIQQNARSEKQHLRHQAGIFQRKDCAMRRVTSFGMESAEAYMAQV
ncbi:MAG TPA: hypothetical protein DDY90_04675, partial [Clostridiales bacterium]|nr:hypothetical protein [Clostridiales bacterium]